MAYDAGRVRFGSRISAFLPLLIAVAAAVVGFLMPHPITLNHVGIGDVGPPLVGIAAFLHHQSPYDVALRSAKLAPYPFTAMIVVAPLLLVPLRFIAAVFCGLISYALAEAIRRTDAPWRYLIFLTPSFITAIHSVQWSPLLTAALLVPALFPFVVVKPQLGLVLAIAGRFTRRTLLVAAALVALSLAAFPRWPLVWYEHLRVGHYNGRPPLLMLPGVLLLVSAIAWRNWRGRTVLAMAIAPQRFFYDQLLLFVAPETPLQMLILLVTSWLAVATSYLCGWWIPRFGDQDPRAWIAVILGFHLPAATIAALNERRRRRATAATAL